MRTYNISVLMTSLSTQTHDYDGRLGTLYRQIVATDRVPTLTYAQCLTQLEQWASRFTCPSRHHLLQTIHLFRHDTVHNYDPANRIHVEELLPHVIAIVQTFEWSGIEIFLQTLSEISELGSCPQGRTTRLLEFYLPYRT
uniref:Uncharacterized protein n=1 Tax=viral metagenome TaxID=1070528 RepID=A0A6C0BKA7_9ZZZZ